MDQILAVETVDYAIDFRGVANGVAWALGDNQGSIRHLYGDVQGEYKTLKTIKYDTFGRPIDVTATALLGDDYCARCLPRAPNRGLIRRGRGNALKPWQACAIM